MSHSPHSPPGLELDRVRTWAFGFPSTAYKQTRDTPEYTRDGYFKYPSLLGHNGQFTIRDLPSVMRFGLRWPKSAEVMELWLKLPARAMTDDEKDGDTQARYFPKQYLDTTLINWEWLRRFNQVEEGVQTVLATLNTTNARNELRDRFKEYFGRIPFKSQNFPFNLQLGLNPVELHSDWQFQFAEVGYKPLVMDDLYGSLGNFAVYAAVTKAKIFKQADKKYFVNVSEIGLYVRDTFDFNGAQYLGHWSKEGMGLSLGGMGISLGTKLAKIGPVEWKLPG